jgi:hypothetical protein
MILSYRIPTPLFTLYQLQERYSSMFTFTLLHISTVFCIHDQMLSPFEDANVLAIHGAFDASVVKW